MTNLFIILLLRGGILANPRPEPILLVSAIVSIIVGTVFSQVIGKRPLKFIMDIDNATKEVVKGNFDVRLSDRIPTEELRSVAQNFNKMVQELSNTEIFRTDFIENVSHEFKTPCAAIEGYATLLQNKSLTEKKRAESTDRILFNTRRLSNLTGNILLLSRLENQEIEVKKECFSLAEHLRKCPEICSRSRTDSGSFKYGQTLRKSLYC